VPERHGHRSKTLACWVVGLVLAGTTRLPRVAETLGGLRAAKTPSRERRLARLLAHQPMAVVPVGTRRRGPFLRCWRERRLLCVLAAPALAERATVRDRDLWGHSRLVPVRWQVLPVHGPWEQAAPLGRGRRVA
jgi:hypothetical protein